MAFDKTNGPRTTYSLNGSGSITSQAKNGQTTTFNYAPDGERLLSASGGGATTTYNYDAGGLGEIVGYSVTGGTSETTFSYDEFGRQIYSDDGKGKSASYSFDGLDRRDTKREDAKMMDLSYVGSSESLSQEQQFDGGDETRSYDYDAGMERLGMARRNAGQPTSRYRNYSKDANGSVEGLENDQGEVADGDRYAYDPYGQAANTDPAAPEGQEVGEPAGEDAQANPFRFEGHYYDSNVKTYDMQARPYLPQAGRFLTEDRFESAAGDLSLESDVLTQDRYAFAGGNPVNNIEFDGHEPIGSYQNGCDNTYGSDERCAQEKAPRRRASTQNQQDYSYAYSNNWAKGRSTSPAQDQVAARDHGEKGVASALRARAAADTRAALSTYGDAQSAVSSSPIANFQGRDDGRIRVAMFIGARETGFPGFAKGLGDDRSYNPFATSAQSRATFDIDFERDQVTVSSSPSCGTSGLLAKKGCQDAKEIKSEGSFGDGHSQVEVQQKGNGEINISYELSNSAVHGIRGGGTTPSIDGDIRIRPNRNGSFSVQQEGDSYPSREAYFFKSGSNLPQTLYRFDDQGDYTDLGPRPGANETSTSPDSR